MSSQQDRVKRAMLSIVPVDGASIGNTAPRPLPFCFHLLESLPLSGMNTDAAVPGLNREDVYRLEVVSPPQALLDSFSVLARRLRDQIFSLQSESRSLAQLRDTLLPKLISGELRVPDAEAFLKERGL